MKKSLPWISILACALLTACAAPPQSRHDDALPVPPKLIGEPIGVQIVNIERQLRGLHFRVLLDFETDSDLAFIAPHPPGRTLAIDTAAAHTGKHSMALSHAVGGFEIKLASLPGIDQFPAGWTIAGAYFFASSDTRVTLWYETQGRSFGKRAVELLPRRWTPVFIDLSELADPNLAMWPVGRLHFKIERSDPSANVWCDDAILIDNSRVLQESPNTTLAGGAMPAADAEELAVSERGLHMVIAGRGPAGKIFQLELPSAVGDASGWRIDELSALRVCLLHPATGRRCTIYADGRRYNDGQLEIMGSADRPIAAELAAEHRSPARVELPEEMGRVDRNTPGDANNDGYNETTGSYELIASGPLLGFTITPQTRSLVKAVIDIANMPAGKPLVTMDGQLVERAWRLDNGHVLIELPASLERPTQINVRVQ